MADDKDRTVTVEITPPKDPDDRKSFTFPLKETVGAAAREAANAFGYTDGNFTLGHGHKVFTREETLKEADVHDHEHLLLLDVGGGV